MEALRERFGKYHVLEKIAQGGMAEVYKVKTVGIAGFEKIQALKRILPSSAREDRFIRSFIDEARIAEGVRLLVPDEQAQAARELLGNS